MDFINERLKRMNAPFSHNFEINNPLPKKNLSELEHLNDQIFESIKTRTYNNSYSNNNNNNDPTLHSFEKLVNQTRGGDVSSVSGITKDFKKTIRENFSRS